MFYVKVDHFNLSRALFNWWKPGQIFQDQVYLWLPICVPSWFRMCILLVSWGAPGWAGEGRISSPALRCLMDPSHRPGPRQGPVLNIISLITPQPGEAINWGHLALVNTHISSKWDTVQVSSVYTIQYCWDHLKLDSYQQTNNCLSLNRRMQLQARSPFCLVLFSSLSNNG